MDRMTRWILGLTLTALALAIAALAVLVLVAPARSQSWGARARPPSGPVGPTASQHSLPLVPVQSPVQAPALPAWRAFPDGSGWYGLLRGDVQLGCLAPDGTYYPLAGGHWGEPCSPPIDAPPSGVARATVQPTVQPVVGQNFGVDRDKLGAGPKYTHGGRTITRDEAYALVGSGLVDDSRLLTLTLIGSEADRKRALGELLAHPEWAQARPLVKLTGRHGGGYDVQDWQVSRFGFVTTGRPTVYVQQPDGKVLHTADWKGAAPAIDAILGRKPAPPKVPDPKAPDAKPADPAQPQSCTLAAAALGFVISLLIALNALVPKPPQPPES